MTGTVEQQYVVSTRHPYPPDVKRIRSYVWYDRFESLNRELRDGGIASPAERARIIVGIERMMVAASTASIFGHDVHRERAAALLAAELRSADPDCPVPPQVPVPIRARRRAGTGRQTALPEGG